MILNQQVKANSEQKDDAWINVQADDRQISPVVGVRVLNSGGEDIATRRRTQIFKVSSSALEWNFNETLILPIQKSGRNNLSLVFDVITGDEYQKPIAAIKMACSKIIAASSKNKMQPIREVLLWNRKRALRRRFANSNADAPDAPPAVFYAGELIVSVTYVKGAQSLNSSKTSSKSMSSSSSLSAVSKTNIVPIGQVDQQNENNEDRDRFIVNIKKIKALGDDGTNSKSSARVWGALLALFVYFTIGVIVYVYGENYSFVDSLWFCVATITTVGFGDVKPKTQYGKLFTAFYALVGYVLVGVAVGMITAYVVDQQRLKRKLMIQKAQALALGGEDEDMQELNIDKASGNHRNGDDDLDLAKAVANSGTSGNAMSEGEINAILLEKANKRKKKQECRAAAFDWLMTIVPVILVVALGMIVMMSAEGVTAIDVSFPLFCSCCFWWFLGGFWGGFGRFLFTSFLNYFFLSNHFFIFFLIQSFYWALATGTTVGYGDIAPKQEGTKLFGCFYVFLIVAVTARIVGKISDIFLSGDGARDVQSILGKKPDAAFLRSLDTDGSGDVTAIEYLTAMLVRLQFVEQDKVDLIMKSFHKLDVDGSGTLSIEDLVSDMDNKRNDNDGDFDEIEIMKKPTPGGRYSFTGPIGDGVIMGVRGGVSKKESNEKGADKDILEEAEALISTGPETDNQPLFNPPPPPPSPPQKMKNGKTKRVTEQKEAKASNILTKNVAVSQDNDARCERDVLDEATEVLKHLGLDDGADLEASGQERGEEVS